MLKFLRKYQAWILAIGGSLLMVAFLMPQAIQQLGQMSVRRIDASLVMDGSRRDVDPDQWFQAQAQVAYLTEAFGDELFDQLLNTSGAPLEEGSEEAFQGVSHWFLLRLAAERAGLIGGLSDGDAFLDAYAANLASRFQRTPEEMKAQLMSAGGAARLDYEGVLRAVADFVGVQRLITMYRAGAPASDARLKELAYNLLHRVQIDLLFVDAANFIDEEPEPDEATLQAIFEANRDVEPGEGEHGLGYRLPDRVKFEYLRVDYQSILDSIDDSGLEARKWYLQHRDEIADAWGQDEAPPYEEISREVRLAYQHEQAQAKAEEIIRFIKARILREVRDLPRSDGDVRVLPDDWAQRRASFEAIRGEVEAQFGVRAEYSAHADRWWPVNELTAVGPIGRASRRVGAQRMSFPQLVASHVEFGQPVVQGLQAGLADADPVRGQVFPYFLRRPQNLEGDVFFYRVLEADPARAPQDLSEVRETVVRDAKRLAVYRRLESEIDRWRQRAVEEGLQALAAELGTRTTSPQLTRYQLKPDGTIGAPNVPPLGEIQALADAVFEVVERHGPLADLSTLDAAERTVVVPAPDALGLAIAQVGRQTPVSRESFARFVESSGQGDDLASLLAMTQLHEDLSTPFTYDALVERFQFQIATAEDDEQADDGSTDDGEAPTGGDESVATEGEAAGAVQPVTGAPTEDPADP